MTPRPNAMPRSLSETGLTSDQILTQSSELVPMTPPDFFSPDFYRGQEYREWLESNRAMTPAEKDTFALAMAAARREYAGPRSGIAPGYTLFRNRTEADRSVMVRASIGLLELMAGAIAHDRAPVVDEQKTEAIDADLHDEASLSGKIDGTLIADPLPPIDNAADATMYARPVTLPQELRPGDNQTD
ncbi:MAG TPA: hypothetical protein VF733_03430 [Candidatus Saccharimonadales bacterium]